MSDTETLLPCGDNGDIQMWLDLVDDPGCSMLVLRIATWDERDQDGRPPADSWTNGDHAGLDLNDMRRLHTRLGELVARVEAHDAALMAGQDGDDEADEA